MGNSRGLLASGSPHPSDGTPADATDSSRRDDTSEAMLLVPEEVRKMQIQQAHAVAHELLNPKVAERARFHAIRALSTLGVGNAHAKVRSIAISGLLDVVSAKVHGSTVLVEECARVLV